MPLGRNPKVKGLNASWGKMFTIYCDFFASFKG